MMMLKAIKLPSACAVLLCLVGCSRPEAHQEPQYQRFVLVPNPSGINKDIPAGALALDTKTGLLCYTVGGSYTSELPAMDMCVDTLKNHP